MADNPLSNPAERSKSLHYRLTNDEWVQAVRKLKPAQKDVLYYLRTLDPFGDRYLDLKVREIARTLGYDPGTVSRALKSLDDEGYIDLDLLRVGVRIKSRSTEKQPLDPVPEPESEGCCSDATVLSTDNMHDPDATDMIATQHLLRTDNTCGLEPLQDKGSGSPHTIHTNQTYLKERERESSEFSTDTLETNQESKPPLQTPASVNDALTGSTQAGDTPEKTPCSAEADAEFFDWVVTYKIPKLPNQPASPRCAAEGWIRKQRAQLYTEYQGWLNGLQKATTAHSGQPPPFPLPDAFYETPQERLKRLRQLWPTSAHQKGIRKAIQDNPQWGFEIGPDGPQEKTQCP
ncbi:MAG TPA: helix-turn-helix domain-containing protein [Trichocoleus sp.]